MPNTVKLQNLNRTMKVEVHSSDGDSIQLMPNSVQDVEEKFNWNLPSEVRVFRPSHTVFGKKGPKEVVSKKDVEELSKDVSEPRATITSGNTPSPPSGASKGAK